ncbi:MAG: NEAr transporter [Paenibacillus sp.]|nr:NEAr transporter [Paenibacillus sp.]
MKISGILAALWIALLVWPAGAMAAGDLADGTYTADYLILKAENDSVSMANDYWEKPATVTIKDGKAKVRVKINHSFWVTEFKVPGSGGAFVDTKVISSNKKADTRLVEFSADITKPMLSKIHVTVEEIDYDHDYTIRFVFDEDSFKLVKGATPAATAKPTEKPSEKPTTAPIAKPAATEQPAQDGARNADSAGGSATGGQPAGEASASVQPTTTPKVSETATTPPSGTATTAPAEGSAEPSISPMTEQEQGKGASGDAGVPAAEEAGEAGASESAKDGEARLAAAGAEGGEDMPALAAGETAGETAAETTGESGGSGLMWWTPIAAVLILAAGGFYIWRSRKAR